MSFCKVTNFEIFNPLNKVVYFLGSSCALGTLGTCVILGVGGSLLFTYMAHHHVDPHTQWAN